MDVVRTLAKSVFAAADLVLPPLRGPRILLYHQVGTALGRQMEVSVAIFEAHLDWLEARGTVVDLETALARREEPDSDRLYVLTFDDGYEDVFTNAFPLLRERGLPFTIYLTTHPVESGVPLASGAIPLTWDQLGEMSESGLLTLGSHTHTHVDVRSLSSDELAFELGTSDSLIETRVGQRPKHFAYPWGFWSSTAELAISKRYDSAALATVQSITETTDIHRIPRIPIQKSDGVRLFIRKLKSGLRAEDLARRVVKGNVVPSTGASR